MSLWDNIRKRRAAGKPRLKPGQKGYPKTLDVGEGAPGTSTGSVAMPPTARFKPVNVTDRRRRKGQEVLLKRFRQHMIG